MSGKIKHFFTLLFVILVLGCSGSDDDIESFVDDFSDDVEDVVFSDDEPSPPANPIARSTEIFGENGNLWKPVSDEDSIGAGNLVVLLGASFTQQFDRCEVRTNDGQVAQLRCIDDQAFTQIPFSCFSNGNRQTWRANFRCSSAAEVRVTCFEFNQEVVFTVPEGQTSAVCSRFG